MVDNNSIVIILDEQLFIQKGGRSDSWGSTAEALKRRYDGVELGPQFFCI